jgi:hypothetical protein
MRGLHETFLEKFAAVPQWQDGGFEKPKFHPSEHLEEQLDEFGPFRAYWCFPWEAYLQILKRMFEMCNWMSAPTTVAMNWATKSVMHYRNPSRGSWFTDDVEASSEFSSDLAVLAEGSPLLRELLMTEAPCSVRSLRCVTRNGDPVKVGDWVVVRQLSEPTRAGCVREMLECATSGEAFSSIRLRCENCKDVHDDETTGAVWAALGESDAAMIVSFEKVHIEVVIRSVMRVRDEFV